jgi:hypothetical protein
VPDRLRVRRRTVVTGVAATLLMAGCDNGDEIAPPDASGSPSETSSSAAAPERTPDEVLVEDVLAELTTVLAGLAQAWKAPPLRKAVGILIKAHRQHLRVLGGRVTDPSPPGPPPDPAAALALARRRERHLHATLVDAAGRAESGALAKLLASMSASVTQYLAVLPQEA